MRLDGAHAPDDWVADAVGRCADLFAAHAPSFFEATVALSFLFFAEHGADLAVVEVGLGGRFDATNVITPRVAAVTHVGLDHTDLLGATLPEIAREKAGIAKPGMPLLHALPAGAARDALESEAAARGATVEAVRDTCRVEPGGDALRITTPARTLDGLALGLPGAHQAWNAALAVRAAEHALPGVTDAAIRTGLADVVRLAGLRGRGETVAPGIVADVAHNADGWRAALDAARPAPGGRLYVAVGVMADKDADALARLLADAGAMAVPVALPGDRARSRADLAARLAAHGVPVLDAPDLPAALRAFDARRAPDDRLLVTGSHLTVAALLEALAAADRAK
jgi:dihydrofolate synthase/folylpolyglutamate synthase